MDGPLCHFQIEGGWDEGGKSPSIWDTWTEEGAGHIAEGADAKVACDSYHKGRVNSHVTSAMVWGMAGDDVGDNPFDRRISSCLYQLRGPKS